MFGQVTFFFFLFVCFLQQSLHGFTPFQETVFLDAVFVLFLIAKFFPKLIKTDLMERSVRLDFPPFFLNQPDQVGWIFFPSE